jgi:thiamine biosynthesis lipoprotein
LCGCEKAPPPPSTTAFAANVMTIDYHIQVGKSLSPTEITAVQHLIDSTFKEVNDLYNIFNPDSELSTLNRLPANTPIPLSPQLEHLLRLTDHVVKVTQGRFDPTIKPLYTLWKTHLEQQTIPDTLSIATLQQAVGWNKIHVTNGQLTKDHDQTSIDLGGIAKGYAVDLLIERLNHLGYPDVIVEWGGEIRASGIHPDQRSWNIFISRLGDPNPDHAIDKISLNNQAIATSGDYLQNWKIGETTYFHIIDPRTGQPLISAPGKITSASVVANACWFADGLATAAMLFNSPEEAKQWIAEVQKEYPEIAFWLVTRDD